MIDIKSQLAKLLSTVPNGKINGFSPAYFVEIGLSKEQTLAIRQGVYIETTTIQYDAVRLMEIVFDTRTKSLIKRQVPGNATMQLQIDGSDNICIMANY